MAPEDAADTETSGGSVTADDIKRQVQARLSELDGSTDPELKAEHQRLVLVWQTLKGDDADDGNSADSALVPVPVATLAQLASQPRQQDTNVPAPETPLRDRRQVVATKVESDFRNRRTAPAFSIGTATALVVAVIQALGTDLGREDRILVLALGLGVLAVIGLLQVKARRAQNEGERILRRMLDTDVHGLALEVIVDAEESYSGPPERFVPGFRRSTFRSILDDLAYARKVVRDPMSGLDTIDVSASRDTGPGAWELKGATVDLPGALDEATDLALQRFVDLGVVSLHVRYGRDWFIVDNWSDD